MNLIIKILLIGIIAFFSGFLEAMCKDRKINATKIIYTIYGMAVVSILNN